MNSGSLVVFNETNGIAHVQLNRPEKLNALNWDLIEELSVTFKKIQNSPNIRCVVISSSTPKAFCAGADLSERLQMTEEKVVETLSRIGNMINALEQIEVPSVAVLNGIAFGGGLELALACDLRISSPTASMGLTETSLAIIPGAGGTQRLPRIIGEAKAKEFIFMARKLSGIEAKACGLVNEVNDNPLETALLWAKELCDKGPLALRLAKKAISQGRHLELSDALGFERECYLELLSSKDRVEGLKAFVEKRKPNYQGN